MQRRLLVAGNWKMNGGMKMTTELISGVSAHVAQNDKPLAYDILVCPPAPYLAEAVAVADQATATVAIGAQTVSQYSSGAYTGEVSLPMLAELGCTYVLLGHSERREYYGETDALVAEKFAACVSSQAGNQAGHILPVLCVGETLAEREAGDTEKVVARQINAVIDRVGIQAFKLAAGHAVIAYEPVWAIGTGKTASPEQAQEVHKFIRELLAESDASVAQNTLLLYGGSVKPANAEELFAQQDIDGGLIGGASLDVESFAGICEAAQKLTSG